MKEIIKLNSVAKDVVHIFSHHIISFHRTSYNNGSIIFMNSYKIEVNESPEEIMDLLYPKQQNTGPR
jgi:competence transcription factor ComK